MLESTFQARLIKKLRKMFPGCEILKNDSGYQQGIPDLSIFWGPYYAFLEVKPDRDAEHEPNQDYFIEKFAHMSFAAFIYPENEIEVLDALQQAFGG